jgi:hypothetical protein
LSQRSRHRKRRGKKEEQRFLHRFSPGCLAAF